MVKIPQKLVKQFILVDHLLCSPVKKKNPLIKKKDLRKHKTYNRYEIQPNKKNLHAPFLVYSPLTFVASTFPSLRPARDQNTWEANGTIKVLSGF